MLATLYFAGALTSSFCFVFFFFLTQLCIYLKKLLIIFSICTTGNLIQLYLFSSLVYCVYSYLNDLISFLCSFILFLNFIIPFWSSKPGFLFLHLLCIVWCNECVCVCVSGDRWLMLLDRQLEVIPPPENGKWKDTSSAFFSRFRLLVSILRVLSVHQKTSGRWGKARSLTWLCLS